VDADESVLHEPAHEKSRGGFAGCRLCELRCVVRETTLNPRPERPPFDVAIGVAAPSLEAWLLHGRMPEASEEHWKRRATRSGSRVYIQDLKRKKYGTTTPSVPAQIERGVPNATSVARDLDGLAEAFPAGFRPLLATIREACGT